MIRVLGKSKDGNLISDNLEYVFTQDFAIAYKLFDLIPLSVIFALYAHRNSIRFGKCMTPLSVMFGQP